jgi:hypothetical protein
VLHKQNIDKNFRKKATIPYLDVSGEKIKAFTLISTLTKVVQAFLIE